MSEMDKWWSLPEIGSDFTIIGSGDNKRLVNNQAILHVAHFFRRWHINHIRTIHHRNYKDGKNRSMRRALHSSHNHTNGLLNHWFSQFKLNCIKIRTSNSYLNMQEDAVEIYKDNSIASAFSHWYHYQKSGRAWTSKVRYRRAKQACAFMVMKKMKNAFIFLRLYSKNTRSIKRECFIVWKRMIKLNKLYTFLLQYKRRNGFKRLYNKTRSLAVEKAYKKHFKLGARVQYWRTFILFTRRMIALCDIGASYYISTYLHSVYLKWGKRVDALRKLRIKRYKLRGQLNLLHQSKALRKLQQRVGKGGARDDCLYVAIVMHREGVSNKFIKGLLDMSRRNVDHRTVMEKAEYFNTVNLLSNSLKRFVAYYRSHRRKRTMQAFYDSKLVRHIKYGKSYLLNKARVLEAFRRNITYQCVYDADHRIAYVHILRKNFKRMQLECSYRRLRRHQSRMACMITDERKLPKVLQKLKQYTDRHRNRHAKVTQFVYARKVKIQWFRLYYCRLLVQKEVKHKASELYNRKQGRRCLSLWTSWLRKRKVYKNRYRAFRLLNPLPHCANIAAIFYAWSKEYVPYYRRCRKLSQTLQFKRSHRCLRRVYDHWTDAAFVSVKKTKEISKAYFTLKRKWTDRMTLWLAYIAAIKERALTANEAQKLERYTPRWPSERCHSVGYSVSEKTAFCSMVKTLGCTLKTRRMKLVLQRLITSFQYYLSSRYFSETMLAYQAFHNWSELVLQKKEKLAAWRAQYTKAALRCALFNRNKSIAVEWGDMSTLSWVFSCWKSPIEYRKRALAVIFNQTKRRPYFDLWREKKRQAYVYRCLPTSAIHSHQPTGYATAANIGNTSTVKGTREGRFSLQTSKPILASKQGTGLTAVAVASYRVNPFDETPLPALVKHTHMENSNAMNSGVNDIMNRHRYSHGDLKQLDTIKDDENVVNQHVIDPATTTGRRNTRSASPAGRQRDTSWERSISNGKSNTTLKPVFSTSSNVYSDNVVMEAVPLPSSQISRNLPIHNNDGYNTRNIHSARSVSPAARLPADNSGTNDADNNNNNKGGKNDKGDKDGKEVVDVRSHHIDVRPKYQHRNPLSIGLQYDKKRRQALKQKYAQASKRYDDISMDTTTASSLPPRANSSGRGDKRAQRSLFTAGEKKRGIRQTRSASPAMRSASGTDMGDKVSQAGQRPPPVTTTTTSASLVIDAASLTTEASPLALEHPNNSPLDMTLKPGRSLSPNMKNSQWATMRNDGDNVGDSTITTAKDVIGMNNMKNEKGKSNARKGLGDLTNKLQQQSLRLQQQQNELQQYGQQYGSWDM